MISETYLNKIQDPAWLHSTVDEIFAKGYVVLPNFLTPTFFEEVQAYAKAHGYEEGGMMTFSKQNDGTAGHRLARSPEFMALFEGIHQARCAKEGKACAPLRLEQQTVGYPYKDARGGKRSHETDYHYDGAYVNTTLTFMMPEHGGELIAFPNIRTNPKSFMTRAYSRLLRHLPFLRRMVPHIIARTKPNDLCVFFGDRTFHGVEPITSGERLIMTINNHW
jgi:hypothetical protein